MKGLIAIVCLALAGSALAEEQSQLLSKSYNIGEGEVINSLRPFSKDEMVYAVCEGSEADKKCTINMESTLEDDNNIRTCDLNLKYSGKFDNNVILINAGNSRAIMAIRDGEAKMKLMSINMNGCRIHEASIDVSKESMQRFYSSCLIAPRENTYDVIFRNRALCGESTCRATFDYEGKLIKGASSFPLKNLETGLSQIECGKTGCIVVESNGQTTEVYLVKDEDPQKKVTLLTGAHDQLLEFVIGLSARKNKFGICTYGKQKVMCKQYDREGKTKLIETEIPAIDSSKLRATPYLDMLNLEKGFLLAMSAERTGSEKSPVAVTYIDEHGKRGKTVTMDSECEEQIDLAKLFKNDNGQYCVNFICMPPFETNKSHSKFSRTTRCFLSTELF